MATKSVATEHHQPLIRAHLPELVLIGTAAGFAVTLAEMLATDHTDGTQAVAAIAAGTGVALCLTGLLVRSRIVLRTLAIGLLLLSITGPVGVFLHAGGEAEASEAPYAAETVLSPDDDDDENEGNEEKGEGEEDEDEGVPPLAPLGLSGLGLLGAAAVLARED